MAWRAIRFTAGKIATVSMGAISRGGSRRWIGDQSWGADALRKSGEKLEEGRAPKEIVLSKDAIGQCPDHIKALCDELLQLNVIEIQTLLSQVQGRLGIRDDQIFSASGGGGGAQAAAPAAAAAAPVAAAPKDTVDIKIGAVDAKSKIKVIKEVRVITGLGLAESKALVEKAPVVIKTGVKKEEAEKLKKLLADAGATVEML